MTRELALKLQRLAPYVPALVEVCARAKEDPALLAALMLRETEAGWAPTYSPKGSPDGVGDGGHGRGLFQIDDRGPFRRLIKAAPWPVVAQTAAACHALRCCRQELAAFIDRENYLEGVLCAYNAGSPKVRTLMLVRRDPNLFTAHRNYGRDVLARYAELRAEAAHLFQRQAAPTDFPTHDKETT